MESKSPIKAWWWGLLLTVPSAAWFLDWLIVRYGGLALRPLISVIRPISLVGLVAAFATPLTVPIVVFILVRYWRMGMSRWLTLLTSLVCSIGAGAITWWGILLLASWHD